MGTGPGRSAGRGAAALLAGAAVLLAAGCGIRTTQVPVDAGPAPSRMPCEVSGENVTDSRPLPVRVYLVCAAQLKSVDRTTSPPAVGSAGTRLQMAQALLAELQRDPSAEEREAGFDTFVRGPMVIGPARAGDPDGTLRLSRQPEDLPDASLAQIVCTFADSQAAAPGGSVILGGPGEYPPRTYACTDRIKNRPERAVPTVGPEPSPSS
ncbi:hypothetical protein [Streptomyces sp. CAU 1734]|uniref:hypothetical protein n=1 Tax=Streptomyces sp. CAU 1734 TaxID=3140360 RepID=UPI003261C8C2